MNEATLQSGSLGRDLRRLRQSRGLRIADLAALIGRSTGWISQVERDRSQPGFADLEAFARAFDVPLSQLFRHAGQPVPDRARVLRAHQRRVIPADSTGATDDLLVPVIGGLQFFRSVLLPQSASDRPLRRGGREMGYVISGELELWIDGCHHVLGAGDSFWTDGETISWLNPHETPCTVIWLLAPLADDLDA